MQVSSRIVYGRKFHVTPVWMWWLQRLSGIALGPLVALHIWMPDMAQNRLLNAVLLAMVVGHGYSGIKRLVQSERASAMITMHAWLWLAVVTVLGFLIVLYGR